MSMAPNAKSASKALQNPLVASVAAAGLTAVTGTPVSPDQVVQGAKMAETGLNMKEKMDQKNEQQQEKSGPKMGK
jgi:hypothetical protein